MKNQSKTGRKVIKKPGDFFWEKAASRPWAFVIIWILVFIIYAQVINFRLGKLDEDQVIISNLSFLKDFRHLKEAFLRDAFLTVKGVPFYRPVQTLTFMVDAHLTGRHAWAFYFTNLVIHALTCSALFYLLNMLSSSRKHAFLVTCLFLVSPLFVHTVAWAPSRGDLLLCLFGVLTFIFFIKYLDQKNKRELLLSVFTFALALFSKETAILLPLLALTFFIARRKEQQFSWKYLMLVFACWLPVILAYFLLRNQVVKIESGGSEFGFSPFIFNLRTFPEFLSKFFLPLSLAPMPAFTAFNTMAGLMIAVLLAWLIARFSARPIKLELWAVAWFLLFMLPAALYRHRYGSAAYDYLEQRAYLPMVGIAILCCLLIDDIAAKTKGTRLIALLVTLIFIFGIYSFVYCGNYLNPMTFYNLAVSTNPGSALALNNRGLVKASNKDVQGAISDYDQAIEIFPGFDLALSNRALSKTDIRDFNGAVADCDKALIINPHSAEIHVNKGIALYSLGNKQAAITEFRSAVKLNSTLFQAHLNLAVTGSDLGLFSESVKEYTLAIGFNPGYTPPYLGRAAVFYAMQDYKHALDDFNHVIELDNKNDVAFLYRGRIKNLQNNREGACSDWETASVLGNKEARSLLDEFCKK